MSEPTPDETTRWPGVHNPQHSAWYIQRFRDMAAQGADLQGESRLIDVLAPRGARLLDAGCGPGRHGGQLSRLGHHVVGVDVDPHLIAAARADHPDATWLVGDLVTLDLAAQGQGEPFDGALIAGNVMDFIAESWRGQALARVASALRRDGFLVVGCRTGAGFSPAELDGLTADAGLSLDQRFATWDLRPWTRDAGFCVSVLRRTAQG